jgi:hypothetical protein
LLPCNIKLESVKPMIAVLVPAVKTLRIRRSSKLFST